MLIDFQFDFGDPVAAQSYYKQVIPSAQNQVAIPCILGALLVDFIYIAYDTRGDWRGLTLLGILLCAAPYFELVVKKAEIQLIELPPGTAVKAMEALLPTISNGHVLLSG